MDTESFSIFIGTGSTRRCDFKRRCDGDLSGLPIVVTVDEVSHDAPPVFMTCDSDLTVPSRHASHGIHHPVFGVKLKEKADSVGMECHLLVGKGAVIKPKKYQDAVKFLEAILLPQ